MLSPKSPSPVQVRGASNLEEKLPINSHFAELRKRLLASFIAVVITTIVSFIFAQDIFDILKSRAADINLIYIEMTEMIGTYFKVTFASGIALALPFLLYQLVMFIRPGLTPNERKYLYILLPSMMVSFACGVAFGYFVLLPPALRFLVSFGSEIATPQIRVENYVSLVLRLLFALGLCFEAPLLIFFLAKIRILTPERVSGFRKFAIVGAFVLGAIITPTFDPINQTLVAVPIILLYEVGILLAKLAWWSERR
jgi:sec-independent protein translocase protein TatC